MAENLYHKAWMDLMGKFTVADRRRVANLLAHKWHVASITVASAWSSPVTLNIEGHPPAPAPTPPGAEWNEVERIRDLPGVDEALMNFKDDCTGDNATCIVRAVMRAVANGVAPSPQSQQEGPAK